MTSSCRIMILALGGALLISAAPLAHSEPAVDDIQSAMMQESYASFVEARAAQQARSAGYASLGQLLDQLGERNKARFDDHNHLLPADSLDDRLTQVLGAAIAQEIQYEEAAMRSRAENDTGMAAHFEELANDARQDRHLFEVELQRAQGSKTSLPSTIHGLR